LPNRELKLAHWELYTALRRLKTSWDGNLHGILRDGGIVQEILDKNFLDVKLIIETEFFPKTRFLPL
jgi:hypothetical protein